MNSRVIIAEAWEYAKTHRRLMWWYAFVPSILTTLVGIFYILYQFFAFKSYFDNAPKSFSSQLISTLYTFLDKNSYLALPALIVVIIVLILYALLPTLSQGGMIQLIARERRGETPRLSMGISYGMLAFLPLLEYHLFIKTFSLFSLFTEAGFVLRNLGEVALTTLLPFFIIAGLVGFFLTLLFTFAEFFIVLEKKNVLTSVGLSAKLVILSWQHTFLIAILMLIIGLRVIFNIVAVLLVPALLFFSVGFLATITLTKIGIGIGIFVSFIALLFASYLTGILNVFANAVWTYTFLALVEEKEVKEVL